MVPAWYVSGAALVAFAGVLSAAYLANGRQLWLRRRFSHWWGLLAWTSGWAVALIPMEPPEYPMNRRGTHLFLGWLVVFLLTGFAARLKSKTADPLPENPPSTSWPETSQLS